MLRAQRSSARASCEGNGLHEKIARRAGDSSGIVPWNGPPTVSEETRNDVIGPTATGNSCCALSFRLPFRLPFHLPFRLPFRLP